MTDNIDEALLSNVTLSVSRALNLQGNNRTLGKRIIGVAKLSADIDAFTQGNLLFSLSKTI
jgi:hypothetical protein